MGMDMEQNVVTECASQVGAAVKGIGGPFVILCALFCGSFTGFLVVAGIILLMQLIPIAKPKRRRRR